MTRRAPWLILPRPTSAAKVLDTDEGWQHSQAAVCEDMMYQAVHIPTMNTCSNSMAASTSHGARQGPAWAVGRDPSPKFLPSTRRRVHAGPLNVAPILMDGLHPRYSALASFSRESCPPEPLLGLFNPLWPTDPGLTALFLSGRLHLPLAKVQISTARQFLGTCYSCTAVGITCAISLCFQDRQTAVKPQQATLESCQAAINDKDRDLSIQSSVQRRIPG